jgi:hypothetical protein
MTISPHGSPQGSPHGSPQSSPRVSPQGSPQGSPHTPAGQVIHAHLQSPPSHGGDSPAFPQSPQQEPAAAQQPLPAFPFLLHQGPFNRDIRDDVGYVNVGVQVNPEDFDFFNAFQIDNGTPSTCTPRSHITDITSGSSEFDAVADLINADGAALPPYEPFERPDPEVIIEVFGDGTDSQVSTHDNSDTFSSPDSESSTDIAPRDLLRDFNEVANAPDDGGHDH